MQKKHIITITGKPGSGKSSTAKELARRLNYGHYSAGDLMRQAGAARGMDIFETNHAAEKDPAFDKLVDMRAKEIGETEDERVLDGRTGWYFVPQSFKVYLTIDPNVAAERIIKTLGTTRQTNNETIPTDPNVYADILQRRLESEIRRYDTYYGINPYDESHYDLVVDTGVNDFETAVKSILDEYQAWLQKV